MRRSAIIATCVLLVATLVSPGVAMAKGGNGRHSVETPELSAGGKAKAGNGSPSAATPEASNNGTAKKQKSAAGKKPQKSATGKKPAATTKPKAASPQKDTTTKSAEKPVREAPQTEGIAKAQKPASARAEQPASVALSTKSASDSPQTSYLSEEQVSSDTIGADGIETRGVLDTIRVKANASLERMRATVAGMWSAVASWISD